MLRRFHLGLANLRKLQRSTEIGPRAPAIDDGLDSEAGVYILPRIPADRCGGVCVEIACGNLAQQWSGGEQLHEGSAAGILGAHRLLRFWLNSGKIYLAN